MHTANPRVFPCEQIKLNREPAYTRKRAEHESLNRIERHA